MFDKVVEFIKENKKVVLIPLIMLVVLIRALPAGAYLVPVGSAAACHRSTTTTGGSTGPA